MSAPRVAFETLGCKLNHYETDAIAAAFQELGWQVVEPATPAEAYVVNTCTVTNRADRKSRNALNHGLRVSLPGGAPVVVVTGCFAEVARESLESQEGVTFVVANANKNQIAALVDGHLRGEVAAPHLPPPDVFGFPTHGRIFHTRTSLKIQDGCDNFCTFCIIPTVRGRATSRPEDSLLTAAREAIAGGSRELVLTGVNLGRWTQGSRDFTDLVESLLHLEGDFRLRITSLEPDGLGERFAALFRHPKMAPHLHLCLQSGSPRVLLAMRREYSLEGYESLVGLLRRHRPDLNLTTDLIVGFPGETEAEFGQSVEAVKRLGFGHVHVFPYSRRRETRAERMPNQVPEAVKAQRSRDLQALARELRTTAMSRLEGKMRRVLVETPDPGRTATTWLRGLTEDYFPVRFRGTVGWNQWADVRIGKTVDEAGEPLLEGFETF